MLVINALLDTDNREWRQAGGHQLGVLSTSQGLHNVLICPKHEVKRYVDLTADETFDLWLTTQKVGKHLESYHKASSLTLAIQTKVIKEYPRHHSSITLMTLMATIQATVYAFCFETDLSQWKLGSSIKLLTTLYMTKILWQGIVATGLVNIATSWCVRNRGPLFASIFYPFCLVLMTFASSLLLEEHLYLGRKEGTLDPRRKLSSTPLVINTTNALSIPKTNPKSNSNPKTKPFSMEPLWVPKGKQKWNIKEGGKVLTTSRDNQ
ncbi:WAT1-related protein [Glycine max]|nr:WAT1-related protein [Glycine max]